MTWTELDRQAMRLALAEAAKGRGMVEPNPMVGAVIVRNGQIIAQGHHERFGGPHAEVHALDQAGPGAAGADLYVTLEPCCHHGKTPPCTERILAAGIRRIVAAMLDPFPKVAGGGFEQLQHAGLTVECGLEEDTARALNAAYLKRLITGKPHVLAKWAMTLDGKIATATGDSRWISGPGARACVHERRGVMDAIIVGLGTVLADDPALTARPQGPRTPRRIVLDPGGSIPLASQLVRTAQTIPTLVVANARASNEAILRLEAQGVEILRQPGSSKIDIPTLLDALGKRGMTNVLVEGGGRILGAFFDAECVDEVDVFIAPVIEAGDHASIPVRGQGKKLMAQAQRLERVQIEDLDGDARIRGWVPASWRRTAGLVCSDATSKS